VHLGSGQGLNSLREKKEEEDPELQKKPLPHEKELL
jgi:hypothetical protein